MFAQFRPRLPKAVSLGALGECSESSTPGVPFVDEAMGEPAPKPDAINQAVAEFPKPSPTIEELMADVEPITSWDDLDIADLTDEEREAFAAALAEALER